MPAPPQLGALGAGLTGLLLLEQELALGTGQRVTLQIKVLVLSLPLAGCTMYAPDARDCSVWSTISRL